MKYSVDLMLAELDVISAHARQLAISATLLEQNANRVSESVKSALTRESAPPQGPVNAETTDDEKPACKCPINQRAPAPVMGHMTRTKCRLCQKEHE